MAGMARTAPVPSSRARRPARGRVTLDILSSACPESLAAAPPPCPAPKIKVALAVPQVLPARGARPNIGRAEGSRADGEYLDQCGGGQRPACGAVTGARWRREQGGP